jgi:hypothetical protein
LRALNQDDQIAARATAVRTTADLVESLAAASILSEQPLGAFLILSMPAVLIASKAHVRAFAGESGALAVVIRNTLLEPAAPMMSRRSHDLPTAVVPYKNTTGTSVLEMANASSGGCINYEHYDDDACRHLLD